MIATFVFYCTKTVTKSCFWCHQIIDDAILLRIVHIKYYSKYEVGLKINTIQYDTIQYDTLQYIQYNAIQYDTIHYNTIQYNTMQYNTIRYDTMQYNTVQYNAIQYNTIQYDDMQYRITINVIERKQIQLRQK